MARTWNHHSVCGNIGADNCAGAYDGSRPYRNPLEDAGAKSDPHVVADAHRGRSDRRNIAWMTRGQHRASLRAPLSSIQRMRIRIVNVDLMRNQDTVADFDGRGRPDEGVPPNEAPLANADLAAMGKGEKLAGDEAV